MIKVQAFYKFLSQLSKRERAILYFSAFFVVLTLLDRLIIYPVYSKMKSLNREIKEGESGIVKDLRILAQKDRIAKEVQEYDSFLNSTKSEEEDMTSLLKEIEGIANKSSLYIVDMKPGGLKEDKGKSKKYLVSLSCEGEMEQVMNFMYNIENSSTLLSIDRYQISPKSKESSIAQCSMTISKIVVP